MKFFLAFFVWLFFLAINITAQGLTETEVVGLMNKACSQMKDGNIQEALSVFLKVGENTKQQHREAERQTYIISQTMAVMCYEKLKQYENGYRLSEELLKGNITESEKKDLCDLYVRNGFLVATSYARPPRRQYAASREILEKILPFADNEMRERIVPKIPLTWYFEGAKALSDSDFKHSLICMENARDGFHEVGNREKEIDALCQIGFIKKYKCDVDGAFEAYKQANELGAALHNDTLQTEILGKLIDISKQLGRNDLLPSYEAKMDSLITSTQDIKVNYNYYNQKGDEALQLGNWQMAELWYKKNEAYINSLGSDYNGPDRTDYYEKLQQLYIYQKDWDKAIKYADLTKSETQRHYNINEPDYYMAYLSFVDIYRRMGEREMCYLYLDSLFMAYNMIDDSKEKESLLAFSGLCHQTFKNYEKALEDYRKVDELKAVKYSETDADRIQLSALIGGMEHRLGHYDESEKMYRRYADGLKILYGDNSTQYITALGYLANAEAFANHINMACKDYIDASNKLRKHIRNFFPYATAEERNAFWNMSSYLFFNMTPFALEAGEYQTEFSKACYESLLLSKGFLLETERSAFDVINHYGTDEDKEIFVKAVAIQTKIKDLFKRPTENSDSILTLATQLKSVETRLMSRCREYADLTGFMNVGYEDVQSKLGKDDVLIDYADFVSKSKGRIYAAYLIDKGQNYPLLNKLFEESVIDSMNIDYPDKFYEAPNAERMVKLLWQPFEDKVKEGSTVYYVPTQMLFQVALESLPAKDGKLLGEHYNFVRLSSARELLRFTDSLELKIASVYPNAVLYGGLQYDLNADEMTVEARKYDLPDLLVMRGDVARGDSVFRPLPGTMKEVSEIERILNAHGLEVNTFTGKHGTEESFINMNAKAPQILHLATHGFFYTPGKAMSVDFLKGYKDAMSLSGLVLAGGNAAWRGRELPKGVLGGILTADNIARLDLTNTKLAVLSACKSGRGEATSEGLYGLQRAFKKAGAQTLIMSLWNVSDVVCTEFMTRFYKYLAAQENHWNVRKAFEKAKADIRKNPKYCKPYYWAGFVVMD